jgi:hypothetical protein
MVSIVNRLCWANSIPRSQVIDRRNTDGRLPDPAGDLYPESATTHPGFGCAESTVEALLCIITGSAEYGAPCIHGTFELEELFSQSVLIKGNEDGGSRSVENDVVERQPGSPK